jgi:hypothetical protein
MEPATFVPSLIWVAPFACLLLGIAIIPRRAPLWESNTRKLLVSAVLGLPVLVQPRADTEALLHTGRDYVSFMILLGSLS